MEVLAPVNLDVRSTRRAWSSARAAASCGRLGPAQPRRRHPYPCRAATDLDSEGQLVASVLSKKAAAVRPMLIDSPVGAPLRKCAAHTPRRSAGARRRWAAPSACTCSCASPTANSRSAADRPRPGGPRRAGGPARTPEAPADPGAGAAAGGRHPRNGRRGAGWRRPEARHRGAGRRARAKFQAICSEQGGMRGIPAAAHRHTVESPSTGRVTRIDNRLLARAAKLAGAPTTGPAGPPASMRTRVMTQSKAGQPAHAAARPGAGRAGLCAGVSVFAPTGIFQDFGEHMTSRFTCQATRFRRRSSSARCVRAGHPCNSGNLAGFRTASRRCVDADVTGRTVVLIGQLRHSPTPALPWAVRGRRCTHPGATRVLAGSAPTWRTCARTGKPTRAKRSPSRTFAALVSTVFDGVVTVDPICTATTRSARFTVPTRAVRPRPSSRPGSRRMERSSADRPDAESEQWVQEVARGPMHRLASCCRRFAAATSDGRSARLTPSPWQAASPCSSTTSCPARTMIQAIASVRRVGLLLPVCASVCMRSLPPMPATRPRGGPQRVLTCDTAACLPMASAWWNRWRPRFRT